MKPGLNCSLLLLVVLAGVLVQALEPLAPYDNFNAQFIDPDKWVGVQSGPRVLETNRMIQGNSLLLVNRGYGNTDSDTGRVRNVVSLQFIDPASVTAIEATVRVTKVEVEGCISNPIPSLAIARLIGDFFNAGIPIPGNATNDVFAAIDILRQSDSIDPSASLRVRGFTRHCADSACLTGPVESVDLGPVEKGRPARLRIQWDPDNNRFIFQRDSDPEAYIAYAVPDAAPPGRPVQGLSVHNFVPNCTALPRPVASMNAFFDDVFVNESAAP